MLIVSKIDGSMVYVHNTDTETTFKIPAHWLQVNEEIQAGDVIKIIKDEVSSQKLQNEADELEDKFGVEFKD